MGHLAVNIMKSSNSMVSSLSPSVSQVHRKSSSSCQSWRNLIAERVCYQSHLSSLDYIWVGVLALVGGSLG